MLSDPDSRVHEPSVQRSVTAPESDVSMASPGTVPPEPLWVFYRQAGVPVLRLQR